MLVTKKLVWIFILFLLVGTVFGQVLFKKEMVKYDDNVKVFSDKNIELKFKSVASGNCFTIHDFDGIVRAYGDYGGDKEVCFKTDVPTDFYYKELNEGVEFGWQITAKTLPSKLVITSNVNLEEADYINWNTLDEQGLIYTLSGYTLTIHNPKHTGGWVDPMISIEATNIGTRYFNQRKIVEASNGTTYMTYLTADTYCWIQVAKIEGEEIIAKYNITEEVANQNDDDFSAIIDDDDIIHIASSRRPADSLNDVLYIQWNTSDNTQIGNVTIVNSTGADNEAFMPDIARLDDGTVGVIYHIEDDGDPQMDVRFKYCHEDCLNYASWSSEIMVANGTEMGDYAQTYADLTTNGTDWFAIWMGRNDTYLNNVQILYDHSSDGDSWDGYEFIDPDDSVTFGNGYNLIIKDNIPMVAGTIGSGGTTRIVFNYRDGGTWNTWVNVSIPEGTNDYTNPSLSSDGTNLFILYDSMDNFTIAESIELFNTSGVTYDLQSGTENFHGYTDVGGTNVDITEQVIDGIWQGIDASGVNQVQMEKEFENQYCEDIEFEMRTDDATDEFIINFLEDGNIFLYFKIDTDDLYYHDGTAWIVLDSASDNTWYKIGLKDFNWSANTYDVYVDDVLNVSAVPFNVAKDSFDKMIMGTDGASTQTIDLTNLTLTNCNPISAWDGIAIINSADDGLTWNDSEYLTEETYSWCDAGAYYPSLSYQYGYNDWSIGGAWVNAYGNSWVEIWFDNLSNGSPASPYVTSSPSLTSPLPETASADYVLSLSWDNDLLNMTDVNATFYWNGSAYAGTEVNSSYFTASIDHGLYNGTFASYWEYNYSYNYTGFGSSNSSSQDQILDRLVVSNSSGTATLDFTVFNESNLVEAVNVTLVVNCDVWYRDSSLFRNYTFNYSVGNNFTVFKSPSGFNLTADCEIYYNADGFNERTYYLNNFELDDSNSSYSLYLESENTAFLVTYQDENYLYVPDVVIDVWRWYPSLGSWVSVEQGTTDFNGMTVVHLVTETVNYRFLVWDNGDLIYTSPDYRALCLDSPCQINLRASQSLNTSVSVYDNISYTYSVNESARTVYFWFSTLSGETTSMNLTIYMNDGYDNETAFSEVLTASGGTISGTVPVGFANTTYTVYIWRDGILFGTDSFTLAPTPDEIFGSTGLILSGLLFIALGLMVLGSGIAVIVFSILGLVVAGLLVMFSGGSIFGLGSFFIWLIIAGGILIWKISQRGVS